MKPALLVLAAGLGNRYGGLKQIDSVGPNGETIIDYSLYDALRAGFGKVVFVIRHCFEDAFRQKVGGKFDGVVQTAYAYQELDACLGDYEPSTDRDKPWGTGHAILVAITGRIRSRLFLNSSRPQTSRATITPWSVTGSGTRSVITEPYLGASVTVTSVCS
ncbi:MAG: glycosyltransferase family protein [Planctomycetota bacterium]